MAAVELLPEYRCHACTAQQKVTRGCERDAPMPPRLLGRPQPRCPRRPIFEDPTGYRDLFRAYRRHMEGMLPEHGGLLDQPAAMMEAFGLIEDVASMCEEERRQAEARGKRRGNGRKPDRPSPRGANGPAGAAQGGEG